MANPLVSVVIPAYNYGHFLPQTLDSVLDQTLKELECIVVDDGSTDGTKDVVATYMSNDPRVSYVYMTNSGYIVARNRGIELARGKYLQFLDADDLIGRRKLELQTRYLEENDGVDIVYSDFTYFRVVDGVKRSIDTEANSRNRFPVGCGEGVLEHFIVENMIPINAPLVKKDLIAEMGGFDESLERFEDWDFWLRCALKGKCFECYENKDALSFVRVHGKSVSKNEEKMLSSVVKIRERLLGVQLRESIDLENECRLRCDQAKLALLQVKKFQLKGYRLYISTLMSARRKRLVVMYIPAAFIPSTIKAKIKKSRLVRGMRKWHRSVS